MSTATASGSADHPPRGGAGRGRAAALLDRVTGTPLETAALPALAGLATLALAFSNGGFFPTSVAVTTIAAMAILLVRIALVRQPAAGIGVGAFVATGALALLATWTLVSASWSAAPAEALIDFDRVLLPGIVLFLFAAGPARAGQADWLVRAVAVATLVVALVALATRLLPELAPAAVGPEPERLSYPLSYWNALGLLFALGLVFWLHLASGRREPRIVRVVAAAAMPPLAVALLLTFSRGGLLVAAVGLVAYLVLARPRGAVGALLAAGPATAFALHAAYGASIVASEEFSSPAGIAEGGRLATTVLVCAVAAAILRALTLPLDGLLAALPRSARRVGVGVLAAAVLVAALAAAAAFDLEGQAREAWKSFSSERIRVGEPTRARLGKTGSPGRVNKWRVALESYRGAPVAGRGAGSYATLWAQSRPDDQTARNAHSLYLETLAELGLVGFVLLSVALLTILGGLLIRIRGPGREAWAALLAAGLVWGLHAGADWDWEMPATGLWLFAAGGLALARSPKAGEGLGSATRSPSPGLRLVLGLAVLALALTPATLALSQLSLDRATRAFVQGKCSKAVDDALRSNSYLGLRPEPFELLAYCDARLGKAGLGVTMMENAVDREPGGWRAVYGLALLRGAAGLDPRPPAREALRRNPGSPITRALVRSLDGADAKRWRRVALSAPLPPEYR